MSDQIDRTDLFAKGLATYARGEHYEAHEVWEEMWHTETDEERSQLIHALIQLASAIHKSQNRVGPAGAARLLDRTEKKLASLPDSFMGINVASLRDQVATCRQQVEQGLASDPDGYRLPTERVPTVTQAATPTWLQTPLGPLVPTSEKLEWFERGLAIYQAGEFFDAHEVWEQLWRDQEDGPERQFLQGIIQVSAGMHKVVAMKHPAPAARLLGRALLRFEKFPDNPYGIDTEKLAELTQASKFACAKLAQKGDEDPILDPQFVIAIPRVRH